MVYSFRAFILPLCLCLCLSRARVRACVRACARACVLNHGRTSSLSRVCSQSDDDKSVPLGCFSSFRLVLLSLTQFFLRRRTLCRNLTPRTTYFFFRERVFFSLSLSLVSLSSLSSKIFSGCFSRTRPAHF